ncbi:GNAT family N-acetyltransferase [Actinocrispum sp. NPDC049592]|uniref:GNAT family N-acetyltransferase n=1 Tax=Actinocrispum sp. NPDC049592 TaxID=3154835 RepID=UPI00344129AA
MRIRPGGAADLPAITAIGDEIMEWFVSIGNTGQWGTEPWSRNPQRQERIQAQLDEGAELWIAEVDGSPAGVLATHSVPHEYIEPAAEPELFIRLLLSSPRYAGQKIGSELLAFARARAEDKGVRLLRVDCYAGGTGDLVRYYERNGFTRTETFTVGPQNWPGQVLEQRW